LHNRDVIFKPLLNTLLQRPFLLSNRRSDCQQIKQQLKPVFSLIGAFQNFDKNKKNKSALNQANE
jgi:hypothetical protein